MPTNAGKKIGIWETINKSDLLQYFIITLPNTVTGGLQKHDRNVGIWQERWWLFLLARHFDTIYFSQDNTVKGELKGGGGETNWLYLCSSKGLTVQRTWHFKKCFKGMWGRRVRGDGRFLLSLSVYWQCVTWITSPKWRLFFNDFLLFLYIPEKCFVLRLVT